MNTTLLQNSFLSPEEKYKRSRGYHGEFFVLPDFDDGWKQNLQDQVFSYLQNLESQDIWVQVYENIESHKWAIHVILDVEQVTQDNRDVLMTLTTALQRNYFMTPIYQDVHYSVPERESLPIVLEEPEKDIPWYHRYKLQWYMANMFVIKNEINRLSYLLDTIDTSSHTYMWKIIWDLYHSKQQLGLKYQEMEHEAQELTAQLYLEMSTTALWADSNNTISWLQADALIGVWGNKTSADSDKVLDLVKAFELRDEKLDAFMSQISQALEDNLGIEVEKSLYWVMKDVETSGWFVTSWLNFSTGKQFHKLSDIVEGIKIPWVNIVRDIKIVSTVNSWAVSCCLIKDENNVWRPFYLQDTQYVEFKINGVVDYSQMQYAYFNESWKLLSWWWIDGEKEYGFYKEWWEYKCLDLVNVEKIMRVTRVEYDKHNQVKCGTFYSWDIHTCFFKNNDDFKALKIWESDRLISTTEVVFDTNLIPMNGKYRLWYYAHLPFWKENGCYKEVDIEWIDNEKIRDVKDLIFNDEGVLTSGVFDVIWESDLCIFWKEEGIFQKLAIENFPFRIYATRNMKFKEGRLMWWELKIDDYDKKWIPFWRSGSTFAVLDISWLGHISNTRNLEYDVNGIPVSWEARQWSNGKWYTFHKSWPNYICSSDTPALRQVKKWWQFLRKPLF